MIELYFVVFSSFSQISLKEYRGLLKYDSGTAACQSRPARQGAPVYMVDVYLSDAWQIELGKPEKVVCVGAKK